MKKSNKFGFICALLLFLISEVFAFLTLFYLRDSGKHVLASTGATVILNGHGMLIFRLTPGVKTYIIKFVHTLIEVIALVGAILGVRMSSSKRKNLNVHSFLGYAVLALYILQVVLAIFIYLYMYSSQRRRKIHAACHNFIGIVILQVAIAAAIIEMSNRHDADDNLDLGVITMTLYGVMVNSNVLNPYTEWSLVGPL